MSQSAHSRVYVARDAQGRVVALKELHFALAPGTQEIDAFEREARLLAALTHPAIPRFVEQFQEGSGVGLRLYLATEFIQGESLAARLTRGPLDETEVRALGHAVLDVLVELQRRTPAVFHRDLKPANLMFRPDGAVVLVDFGSARQTDGSRTHRSTLVGTFGYMPPEQLGGTVDRTSDVYALAATLVHALTGAAPDSLLTDDLAVRLPSSVSPALKVWLERALSVDRTRRFANAEEARAELLAKRATPAARPAVSRGFWLALGAGVSLLGLGLVLLAQPQVQAALPTPVAAPHTDGSWFSQVKSRCNALEVKTLMAQNPPPAGPTGQGMGAGCYALAGKYADARALIDALRPGDRANAAYQVFEIAHPVADQGEDSSAGPMMELVIEYWPENYQALYHAGIAEYVAGDVTQAKARLTEFRRVYPQKDFFGDRADLVLDRIAKGLPPEPGVGLGGH